MRRIFAQGTPQWDAAAKQFESKAGVARIYVYRLGSVWYGRFDSRIRIDGKYVGTISKELFLLAEVAPGRHIISATTVHVDGEGASITGSADLGIDASDGGLHFVRVQPGDPPKIESVARAEGLQAVERCHLTDVRPGSSAVAIP